MALTCMWFHINHQKGWGGTEIHRNQPFLKAGSLVWLLAHLPPSACSLAMSMYVLPPLRVMVATRGRGDQDEIPLRVQLFLNSEQTWIWWHLKRVKYLAHTGSPINNSSYSDFPGGPGGKTPCFHSRADGLNPWSGTRISYATGHGQKIEKERKKKLLLLRIRHPRLFPDLRELDTWVWDRLSPRLLHRHAAHIPTQTDGAGHSITSGKHTCQGH